MRRAGWLVLTTLLVLIGFVAGETRQLTPAAAIPRFVVAAETLPRPVAIGENMEERVQPYADRIGADTYQPDPSAPREMWEQNQRDWINKQMDDGRIIHDVGPDPARSNYPGISSPWYQIERDEIARRGYPTIQIRLPE